MNPETLIQKIEALEKQLPRWEKWLFVCYGAAFTMFINAMVRLVERSYLKQAFVFTAEELNQMGISVPVYTIPAPMIPSIFDAISKSLSAPWWTLVCCIILLTTLFPGVLLSVHSEWRKVSINKRLNLIFGFFLASWIVFLSAGAQDPTNAVGSYNFLLIGSAIAIVTGYWWLRRKRATPEEVFP